MRHQGRKQMFPSRIGTPRDLATMTEAFERHCLQHNIVDETDRTQTARLIMMLFQGGAINVDDLMAGLNHLRAVR